MVKRRDDAGCCSWDVELVRRKLSAQRAREREVTSKVSTLPAPGINLQKLHPERDFSSAELIKGLRAVCGNHQTRVPESH